KTFPSPVGSRKNVFFRQAKRVILLMCQFLKFSSWISTNRWSIPAIYHYDYHAKVFPFFLSLPTKEWLYANRSYALRLLVSFMLTYKALANRVNKVQPIHCIFEHRYCIKKICNILNFN